LSNSTLHWVPDHHTLIPKLIQQLNSKGQILFQVPTNHSQEFYVLMKEVAAEPTFDAELKGWRLRWPVLEIDEYASLLYKNNCTNIHSFEKVYPLILPDANSVVNWIQGTGIQSYTSRLSEGLQIPFVEKLRAKANARYPKGPVFFPFRRIFVSGQLKE